jgi:prepilin-type N-terminal cleavage/methylation domain-containing protein
MADHFRANNKLRGFSMLELLVVLAIFGITAFIILPFSIESIQQNKLVANTKTLIYNFFSQQQDAHASRNGSAYGLAFYNNRIVTYAGTSLASSSDNFIYYFDNAISLNTIDLSGGGNEINFALGSFKPNHIGTLVLSDGFRQTTVYINREGLIYYALSE